jgi:hypothetical protein
VPPPARFKPVNTFPITALFSNVADAEPGPLAVTSPVNAVRSVFGRTGAVVATVGDYSTSQVTEGTNLYYTDTRARNAITLTTTGTSGASTYTGGTLNIPSYSVAGLGAVPDSRTITINGALFDLGANRNFEIGDYGTF